MEDKNKIKGIIYLVIAVVTLLFLIAGATYAYFQAVTGNGANIAINATSSTVDNLTFNKGDDITIKATQQNFGEKGDNQTGSTNVSATLIANNKTNITEDYHYNIYLEVTANDFEYSSYTDPEEEVEDLVFTNEYDKTLGNNRDYNGLTKGYNPIPELFLTISGPEAFNKDIPNLTTATLTTDNDSYDITELREGIYPIAEDVAINVTADDEGHKKVDNWNITVTFKNLPTDQELNTGKTFNARIIIQAEKIANDLSDVCSEGGLLADCIQQLHDQSVYGASNLIYHDGQNDTTRGETAGTLEAGDNSYRYSGSYEKVNNYICLGTDCNNKDNLFRIVGAFGEEGIKVVKADYANKDLLGEGKEKFEGEDLSQANSTTDGSYANTVYNATIGINNEKDAFTHRYKENQTEVDRYYWQENGTETTAANWSTSLLNKIHLNNVYYNKIEEQYQSLIKKHTWIYGNKNATFSNIATAKDAKTVYNNELGTNAKEEQKTDFQNIGLLYVSDYLYGATPKNWNKKPYTGVWGYTSDGAKKDKNNNPAGGFPETQENNDYRSVTDSNWLYMGLWEWLITVRSDVKNTQGFPVKAFYVDAPGYVSDHYVGTLSHVVRPSFYLVSNAKYKGGTGTVDNPYTLSVETDNA